MPKMKIYHLKHHYYIYIFPPKELTYTYNGLKNWQRTWNKLTNIMFFVFRAKLRQKNAQEKENWTSNYCIWVILGMVLFMMILLDSGIWKQRVSIWLVSVEIFFFCTCRDCWPARKAADCNRSGYICLVCFIRGVFCWTPFDCKSERRNQFKGCDNAT